jgi:hypothetical protein
MGRLAAEAEVRDFSLLEDHLEENLVEARSLFAYEGRRVVPLQNHLEEAENHLEVASASVRPSLGPLVGDYSVEEDLQNHLEDLVEAPVLLASWILRSFCLWIGLPGSRQ